MREEESKSCAKRKITIAATCILLDDHLLHPISCYLFSSLFFSSFDIVLLYKSNYITTIITIRIIINFVVIINTIRHLFLPYAPLSLSHPTHSLFYPFLEIPSLKIAFCPNGLMLFLERMQQITSNIQFHGRCFLLLLV